MKTPVIIFLQFKEKITKRWVYNQAKNFDYVFLFGEIGKNLTPCLTSRGL